MTTFCLFLKPEVTTAEGEVNQRRDIETFIRPAIEQSGLSVIDDQIDGLEVSDISDDLIQKVYKADILIMDANCYETNGAFPLSPYLYYYMAIGHFRGNVTILVSNTRMHLPYKLITHHTLTYSVKEFQKFLKKFQATVDEIRQNKNNEPDNPIQNYLTKAANQEELARARRQIAEVEEANQKELAEARRQIVELEEANQKELAKERRRIAELEAEKAQLKQVKQQPIAFRKVN